MLMAEGLLDGNGMAGGENELARLAERQRSEAGKGSRSRTPFP